MSTDTPLSTETVSHVWRLTDESINSLQVEDIDKLIFRCRHAHYVNVMVRINGKDEVYEADWLKHMRRGEHPTETRLALLEECAALLWDAADMMNDGPDDSDIAFAQAKLAKAAEKARQIRRLPK
jgi:hypothetical protein